MVQGLRRARQRRYCSKVFTHAPAFIQHERAHGGSRERPTEADGERERAFIQHERAHAVSMPSNGSSGNNSGVSGEEAAATLTPAPHDLSTSPSPVPAE